MSKEEFYNFIVENFQKSLFDIEHLYINNNSERLIITFATFNSGEKFSCVNSHAQLKTYNHLFLKDPSSSFYMGRNKNNYECLLDYYSALYDPRSVTVWGSSMGGYAALKFALLKGFNAFVNCPQIEYSASLEYSWPALYNKLIQLKNFQDISELNISESKFNIYYTYGDHLLDVSNTSVFRSLIKKHPNVSTEFVRIQKLEHTIFSSFLDFKRFLKKVY